MYEVNLAGIVNDSVTDGAGLRLTLFAQGCPRRCKGCHNPTALEFAGGTKYKLEEIVSMAEKNPLLSGVTFSGGEPFAQAEAFTELAKLLRKKGLNICIYTGYTFEELIKNPVWVALLEQADILVDGEFILEKRDLTLKFRGSSNQRVLDVPKSLEKGEAVRSVSPKWV